MRWQPAELIADHFETNSARTLTLRVPGWPGHLPGQHVDVRLTAPDGYHAERSYSLAAPAAADHIELTIQRVPDGEVSGYLVDVFPIGARIEVRGPIGGWFVWNPDSGGPAVLIAGGSGIVPLAAILRARRKTLSTNPFRLLYALRSPSDLYYPDELLSLPASSVPAADGTGPSAADTGLVLGRQAAAAGVGSAADSAVGSHPPHRGEVPEQIPGRRERGGAGLGRELVTPPAGFAGAGDGIEVFLAYSRSAPPGARPPGRLTAEEIAWHALPPAPDLTCYVCGPTPFVEFAAAALVSAGHAPGSIRTERFGPTGG
ncbi:FAD-binding oxidoreductase [Nocardia sp. NBC_01503]|uniref:FAD-binding oxidoreductase n=1 Tax=Nocardia sp. NBC_01503 TaxID=2975997 RepID=UPI002E7AE783|nr:FAD-binding oxidoreductase [Nocardia sp. NBC_01503]WTL32725.1 FAD-binding oxidoreductase [Nocardia sp. NBC_01503]